MMEKWFAWPLAKEDLIVIRVVVENADVCVELLPCFATQEQSSSTQLGGLSAGKGVEVTMYTAFSHKQESYRPLKNYS